MDVRDTDIFISYRRIDGRDIARNIQLALGNEGFERVFFDYTSMREGMFNEQIITAINNCKDYILVLSPQSMLRCNDPEDWVAKELQTAIEAGCKIIPVQVNESFDAWPQDFPEKFNFIKQIEFLTLRTDEYFPDSIRRLVGWLDSKPTRVKETMKNFILTILVDETCELYIDGNRIRKIKGGKTAVLNDLKRGQTYTFKFVSLAQRNSEQVKSYFCPEDEALTAGNVVISFQETRNLQKSLEEKQRAESKFEKEQARQQQGRLMLALKNYDSNGELSDGMVCVCLNSKVGFLNEDGFEAVACEYDDADDFHNGYATICKNGKWGIIDKIGQVVVPLKSETPCWSYKPYKYFVASQNQHYGISTIKRGFPEVFPYDGVNFIDGFEDLFAVKTGDFGIIIDITGAPSPFSLQFQMCGWCTFGTYNHDRWENDVWKGVHVAYTNLPMGIRHPINNRIGYLNSKLRLTIPFVDEDSGESTYFSSLKIIKTNGHMGLVNVETGTFVIPAIYDNIHQFYMGGSFDFFRVADDSICSECTKDRHGKITHENTWYLWGGKQGVLNINGEVVVPQLYQHIQISNPNEHFDQPFFLAYIIKDLKLSWEGPFHNGEMYLRRHFNKEFSTIHIYAYDGTLVKKIGYSEESQIPNITCQVYKEIKKDKQ